MLQIGNHGLTAAENRSHFYIWAILNAPLMIGTDLVRMPESVRDLLTNPGVIEVDQDWGGQQGRRVWQGTDAEIWAKPMSDGSLAAALLNRGERTFTFEVNAEILGRDFSSAIDVPSAADLGISGSAPLDVGARDTMLIRVR
jgi:alpha-galactosidase